MGIPGSMRRLFPSSMPMVPTDCQPASTPGTPQPVACWLEAANTALGPEATVRTWLKALSRQCGATQAALAWYDDGHATLAAEVNVGAPDVSQDTSTEAQRQALLTVAEECIDQGVSLQVPPPGQVSTWVTRAHERLRAQRRGTVLSVPLPGAQIPLGAVVLSWSEGNPPAEDVQAVLIDGLWRLGPILAAHRQAWRPWHWHVRQAIRQAWQRWLHPQNMATRRWRLALLAAALAMTLVPWPDRVGGMARIEGIQQRVMVSPTDGFIKAAHVLPGDHVKADQVLVDLAEQDLQLERDKWQSQIAQQDNAYAAAMTRADRAEAAISLSKLDEAQAQLALVDEQLSRAQLKAPFRGVVIQGDLSQSIGAPVKQGDTLVTVASTDGYRVIMDVDETDIGRIRIGQTGVIALSALPWQTLDLQVQRITPQAQTREGRNVYEVQARFTQPVPEHVRPGLMGPAKIRIGWRPPLWGWIRPVVDRGRLMIWSWWG